MTARKMCGQLRTEQIGVAPGNQKPESLPLQTIDKHFPARKILDFVKKQMTRIAVNSFYGAENFIVIFDGNQSFVIEIYIAVRAGLSNRMRGIKRLSRPPRTGNHLDQIIFEIQDDPVIAVPRTYLEDDFPVPFFEQGPHPLT